MNDIKGTVLKFTNTIAKTSGELIKSTKLSINLASEEEKLKNLYTEIGKKVHEIYIYGGALGAAFDEHIKLVEAQRDKISELKNRIDAVKGTKTCVKCGRTMDRAAEFCPKCGQRSADAPYSAEPEALGEPAAEPPAGNQTAEAGPPVKVCALCGKENENNAKFCFHCGRVL